MNAADLKIPGDAIPALRERLEGMKPIALKADDPAAEWKSIVSDRENILKDARRNVPRLYLEADPATARDPDAFAKVRTWLTGGQREGKPGLCLFGGTGSGKTCAAVYALLRFALDDDAPLGWLPAVELARLVAGQVHRQADFAKTTRLLSDTTTEEDLEVDDDLTDRYFSICGILIDDLHLPRFTPGFAAALYGIVEEQTAKRHTLIVTAQMDALGLLEKWRKDSPDLEATAKAILRRIDDFCVPINFVWEGSPWD